MNLINIKFKRKYYYNTKGCFETNSMLERMNDTLRDDMILEVEENTKVKKQFARLFRNLDRSCQVMLLENFEPAYLNEAEEAHIEGEHGTEIYFLRKGRIRVFCDDPNNIDENGNGSVKPRVMTSQSSVNFP